MSGAGGDARGGVDALRSLLHASHLLAADELASAVARHARLLGAREMVIYLADYEQVRLLPLPGRDVASRQELAVESTVAGLVFRRVQPLTVDIAPGPGAGQRLWLPLLDGVERLGVVEFVADRVTPEFEEDTRPFVSLVAELVVVNNAYSDVFVRLRRRKTLSLAAEIQWELLPPLTFGTDRVVITGALEPAYEIGGDTFDYAANGSTIDLLVLDAIGHGLPAALLATAAVGAYRHARRDMLDLPEIAAAVDEVVAGQFGPDRFATAVVARLDIDTGRLRWVNAGHPAPLILRGGVLVHAPECPPDPPLGLLVGKPACCETRLQRGDRVLFYTDGIVEARTPDGEFFGEQRLADFVVRASADGDPAPETLRRLMRHVLAHQAGQLQDDASIVLVEWVTGDEQRMVL